MLHMQHSPSQVKQNYLQSLRQESACMPFSQHTKCQVCITSYMCANDCTSQEIKLQYHSKHGDAKKASTCKSPPMCTMHEYSYFDCYSTCQTDEIVAGNAASSNTLVAITSLHRTVSNTQRTLPAYGEGLADRDMAHTKDCLHLEQASYLCNSSAVSGSRHTTADPPHRAVQMRPS